MDKKEIGARLKGLRSGRCKKIREVAAAVGISVSALGMYETGQRIPTDDIKVRLAEYFDTTVGDIFFCGACTRSVQDGGENKGKV